MSDLATMEQDIKDTVHALVSTEKIRHRILTSIRFHREKQYFFTERSFQFDLTIGRNRYRPGDGYGLPGDLVEIIGDTVWFTRPGDDQRIDIERLTNASMELDLGVDTDFQSEPLSWDWFDGGLRLYPIPDDTYVLYGPYVRDLGVPVKRYDTATAAWTFWTPDESEALAGDFTNHWFDQLGGYEMVKQRALMSCYEELLNDQVNSQIAATRWLEERMRLQAESEGKAGPQYIPPSLF